MIKRIVSLTVLFLILGAVGLGFWLGMRWQRFRYVDACLDAGGEITTESIICVIKR